ncbi:PREDICTED: serine-rich adhesin for platelets-like [Rhagoletis zephyria]|uniref:serine-rich adhesin for platelets-like n=1 Tax=Rhagoletis zephyria TaxID=28612 RepID=UPI0008116DFE|nr:PREDICTED: serine-rich adhesin for platelets-like [Rhagoletis zephyria]
MNSVDGAPNATILAEGAPTRATVTTGETINSTTATTTTNVAAVVSAKTTEPTTIIATATTTTITSNAIKTTAAFADATDDDRFHEIEPKNVSVCAVEEQPWQRPNESQIMPINEKTNPKTVATPIESAAPAPAIKPINTMGNTKTTNNEKSDNTSATTPVMQATPVTTVPAPETAPPTTATDTTIKIKNTDANDVEMTDMATPEGNNSDNASECTASDITAAGTAVIDNKADDDVKPQPPLLTTAEGDNWKLNEMELCRCCGKPNVTLYDLFPNGNADVSSSSVDDEGEKNEEKAAVVGEIEQSNAILNADAAADTEMQVLEKESNDVVVYDVEDALQASVVDKAKNGAEIKQKATSDATGSSVKDATKATTNDKSKIDCETVNTPKLCYRTIAASIAAATAAATATTSTDTATATANTTTTSASASAIIRQSDDPTCQTTNDPVIDAATSNDVGECGRRRGEEGDAVADPNAAQAGAGATRVKKSATADMVNATTSMTTTTTTTTKKHAVDAANNNSNVKESNNANGQGQNSDDMENILQEMQIWQLWVSLIAVYRMINYILVYAFPKTTIIYRFFFFVALL